MHWDHHLPRPELTSRERGFLRLAWAVIVVKCMVVKWAALATLLWLWHREIDRIIFRNTVAGVADPGAG